MTLSLRRRAPAASTASPGWPSSGTVTEQARTPSPLTSLTTSLRGHGPGQARWTAGQDLAAKACSLALGLAVLAGPVALAGQWMAAPTAPPAAAAAPVIVERSMEVVAGEAAVAWVTAWLTCDRAHPQRLRAWYSGDEPALPAVAAQVERPTVASVQRLEGDTWSVVVAADVTEPGGSTSSTPGSSPAGAEPTSTATAPVRRYYQTALSVTSTGSPSGLRYAAASVQALTLPAPVPGPVTTTTARLDYDDDAAPDTYLGSTVTTFLQALLAGQGDVTRLVSPQTAIAPVQPPVATQVRLRDLVLLEDTAPDAAKGPREDGDTVRLLAGADLTLPSGQLRTSQYALTLTGRDGRWEVSGIDLAPAVRTPNASTTPQPSAATPTQRP